MTNEQSTMINESFLIVPVVYSFSGRECAKIGQPLGGQVTGRADGRSIPPIPLPRWGEEKMPTMNEAHSSWLIKPLLRGAQPSRSSAI